MCAVKKAYFYRIFCGGFMYIHEQNNWFHFTWNDHSILPILGKVRHSQGKILGYMQSLGFDLMEQATMESLALDVIDTSKIEGEFLNPELVRSSIARKLGIEGSEFVTTPRNIDGIVDVLMDATQRFSESLSPERLFGWHHALFQTGYSGHMKIDTGRFRVVGMKVVSGVLGREKVHFEAPAPERVPQEMEVFLDWLNHSDQEDLVLKAAIAHLWFVTIHPFDDGNGRIARAIMDMLLARSDSTKTRFYSMSNQIYKEHKRYNEILERPQKGNRDITPYLEWFLGCFERALVSSEINLRVILDKARFWDRHLLTPFNTRQRQVLNHLFDHSSKDTGLLRTSVYSKLAKCSTDTALRDLQDLVKKGILRPEESGKKTHYRMILPPNLRITGKPGLQKK